MNERKGLWPWGWRRARREPLAEPIPFNAAGVAPATAPRLAPEFRIGWRRADPAIEADVKAFWARLSLLPPDVDPDARAPGIVVAGYAGAIVVASSTAVLQDVPFLRARMAVFRAVAGPAFARPEVFTRLAAQTRAALEAWSRDHPEEGVMGVMTVIGAEAARAKTSPHRPETGLSLAGFTESDEKIMVAWFDHALV
ncbi:MAG TPA: hypothetical protein VKQ54_02420 [Caulobacteraceae bacterium]|nr:hypothetical protein [Caulobacteraceae bacterium]